MRSANCPTMNSETIGTKTSIPCQRGTLKRLKARKRGGETELERTQRFRVSDDALDVLAELPGIEREIKQPPEPDEFEISTYQDVLDAQEAIEQSDGPEVVWKSADA